jgi:hypothetical protein
MSAKNFESDKRFDKITLDNLLVIHTTLTQEILHVQREEYPEYDEFRNMLVLYLKLLNTADRIELTKALKLEKINMEYPNTQVRCRLVYFPKSKLFARLFLYDKTGTINTIPTIVPMDRKLSGLLAIYLNKFFKDKKKQSYHVFGDQKKKNNKIVEWTSASNDLKTYIYNILDKKKVKLDKSSLHSITPHKLRHIFLAYLMERNGYSADCLRLAAILERHDVHQSEVTYMKWTRFGAFKAHFENKNDAPAIELNDVKNDKDTEELLNQYFVPEVEPMKIKRHKNWYSKPIFTKIMKDRSTVDNEIAFKLIYGPFCNNYIGMDTSPNCTAITFVTKAKNGENYIYTHQSIVLMIKDVVLTDDITVCHKIDEFDNEVKKKLGTLSGCTLIAVESRLPLGYRVSASQGRYTDSMRKRLKEMVKAFNKDNHLRFIKQASVKNIIKVLEGALSEKRKEMGEYKKKTRKAKNLECIKGTEHVNFINTFMVGNDESKINNHPYSDLVDSTAIIYFLEKLDSASIQVNSNTSDFQAGEEEDNASDAEVSTYCNTLLKPLRENLTD